MFKHLKLRSREEERAYDRSHMKTSVDSQLKKNGLKETLWKDFFQKVSIYLL